MVAAPSTRQKNGRVWYTGAMTKMLEKAIAKVATLSADEQEKIGEELLAHVEKVEQLRSVLERGLSSLDRGEGKELDMNDVVGRARLEHGSR
jgi:hypothetical protein